MVFIRVITHPNAPITTKYQRGSIILGANVIEAIPGRPNESKVTMITQMDPSGIIPAWFVNRVSTVGPITYMRSVEIAAQGKIVNHESLNAGIKEHVSAT